MAEVFLCFSWALVISMFAIPSIIYVAESKKLLNIPNERSSHSISVPRLGGLAIFAGFLSSVFIFGRINQDIQYLLAGCLILFYIAIKDDLVHVSAFKKFFVQLLATIILVFLGDYRITNFQGLLSINELDLGISYVFTMVVVIAITNSINLIDGINGLAGSLILSIMLTLTLLMYSISADMSLILVAVSLAGAVLGFLRYNFLNARIFMGDAGSLICGFILAALLVKFVETTPTSNAPILAMSIIFIPITDTIRITLLRLYEGKSPFMPDKNHVHHKLLSAGFGQISIVALLTFTNLLAFLFFYLNPNLDNNIGISIFIGFQVFVIFAIGILKEKKTNS
jgi:UDP-GlcNAc:undecaprenyl-phosphate/decaprenyl-phosphate GlcNAc-1-phosphate transferase